MVFAGTRPYALACGECTWAARRSPGIRAQLHGGCGGARGRAERLATPRSDPSGRAPPAWPTRATAKTSRTGR